MKTNIILFFTIIVVLVVLLISIQNQKQSQPVISKAESSASIPLSSATETTLVKQDQSALDSPEGSKTLVVEKKYTEGVLSHSAYILTKADQQKTEIFSNLKTFSNLEIPYNAWSPDNVYFFLKDYNNYFVFQSSGDLFSGNLKYLSFTDLFKNNFPDYEIEDVTGWGGLGLIIINAKQTTDNQKVSFWFDVPSQSFIQLGTYFK